MRRALSFAVASQYYTQAVQLASVMVVWRLLTPAEIGVYSVASVVLMAMTYVRTFGVAQYIIQAPELTPDTLKTGLAAVIIMSWGSAGLLALAAPWLAQYYGEPGLANIFYVVAASFLLTPYISVPYSCLSRELAFDKTMWVRCVSATTQAAVTITCVFLGMSYMSMALGLAVGAISELIVATIVRPDYCPYIPRFKGISRVFRFGSMAAFASLLQRFGEGVPDLVLGRVATMTDVGYYSRGAGVVLIFNQAVTLAVRPVVLPHLSKGFREGEPVPPMYLRAVELQTGLAWPFYAGLSAAMLPTVRLLYGDQWDIAVPIAEILCIWGALMSVYCYYGDVLVAVGRVRAHLLTELLMVTIRVGAVIYVATEGLETVASAVVGVAATELIVTTLMLRRAVDLRPLQLVRACWKSAAVGGVVLVVTHAMAPAIATFDFMFLQFVAFAGTAMLGWAGALILTRHPLLAEALRLLRSKGLIAS
ncbi:MAG: oligosaccharide flippase family protein [Pseudomonadota bacterium]